MSYLEIIDEAGKEAKKEKKKEEKEKKASNFNCF